MFKKLTLGFLIVLAIVATISATQQTPAAKTPAACLQEVRDFAAKSQQEMVENTKPTAGETGIQLSQRRAPLIAQINQAKIALARQCAARIDQKTLTDKDLVSMADLYVEAGQPDLAGSVVANALVIKTYSPAERAGLLVYAVTTVLREPKSDDRNARLEKFVSELDSSPVATIEQKLEAHGRMNSWYRYDDIDEGIIRHSTFIIDAKKNLNAEQRKKYGGLIVGAYVNMAEALAGQGMNDRALALLNTAKTEMSDVPTVSRSVDPEIDRLKLVGTAAAPIKAPRWLNMPGGKTEIAMPGSVTLLEFSAHWCVPCKESYPGVNRLLAKYGARGFRTVLVTRFYGYFEQERNITPEVEFERDRKYFVEHEMNVPIAVGDRPTAAAPDPNDVSYKVGGIPQIHLVDKQGKIRLVMVGYDDANEPKLAKMIEDLLKEK